MNFFFVRAVRIFKMIARCSKCDFWNLWKIWDRYSKKYVSRNIFSMSKKKSRENKKYFVLNIFFGFVFENFGDFFSRFSLKKSTSNVCFKKCIEIFSKKKRKKESTSKMLEIFFQKMFSFPPRFFSFKNSKTLI